MFQRYTESVRRRTRAGHRRYVACRQRGERPDAPPPRQDAPATGLANQPLPPCEPPRPDVRHRACCVTSHLLVPPAPTRPSASSPDPVDEPARDSAAFDGEVAPRAAATSLLTRIAVGMPPPREARALRAWAEQRIGTLLGPYRLIDRIGAGGMGCVYRAEHTLLGRTVALTVLTAPASGHDPGLVALPPEECP